MYPNRVVPGSDRFHVRSPENPPPRKLREPIEWPLIVPALVVTIGLIALALYIFSHWPSISGFSQ